MNSLMSHHLIILRTEIIKEWNIYLALFIPQSLWLKELQCRIIITNTYRSNINLECYHYVTSNAMIDFDNYHTLNYSSITCSGSFSASTILFLYLPDCFLHSPSLFVALYCSISKNTFFFSFPIALHYLFLPLSPWPVLSPAPLFLFISSLTSHFSPYLYFCLSILFVPLYLPLFRMGQN